MISNPTIRLANRFLLKDTERQAKVLGPDGRTRLKTETALAWQKLRAANYLWVNEEIAEAWALCQQAKAATVEAGAVADALGLTVEDAAPALLALQKQAALDEQPVRLNSDVTAEHRRLFADTIEAISRTLEQLDAVATPPPWIVVQRGVRITGLLASVLVLVGLVGWVIAKRAPLSEADVRELAKRDGFLFREAGSTAIYVVQNGTKFLIPSEDEFRRLGYSSAAIREVPPGSTNFLRTRPSDGELYRERDNPAVYLIEKGQKRPFPDEASFRKRGHRFDQVKVLPAGALKNEALGPPL